MAHYIDKDTLVAKIKKLEDEAKKLPSDFGCGRLSICKELMNFLNTIEAKEVDLEKEFDKYTQPITAQDIKDEPFTQLFACAQHFYELGIKAKKGE